MDGWPATQQMIFCEADCSKIFKSKINACPVNAGLYMTFKNCISFATYSAANFGFDRFRISKLLLTATRNHCAV